MIDYGKIEKYSLFTILFGMIVLFVFSLSYSMGFLLGGIASLLAFKWLQRLEYVGMEDYRVLRKSLTKNKLMRYLIYAMALLACFIRPNVFNYIACFIGIMSVRIWLILIGGRYDD